MVKIFPRILLLGDSLTEGAFGVDGYGSAMVADYAARCDVLNRGFGGYNSRMVLEKVKQGEFDVAKGGDGPSASFKLVIINLGTNDSNANIVPIEEFKSNMTSLVKYFKNECGSDVLLLTPSTCNPVSLLAWLHGRGIMLTDTGKTNETSRQYADAVLQVGEETGSPAIDLYELFERNQRDGVRDEELFTDGLHYTPRAYKIISRALRETIDRDLPHLSPYNIPKDAMPFPLVPTDDPVAKAKTQGILASLGLKPGDDMLAKWHELMAKEDKVEREKQMVELV